MDSFITYETQSTLDIHKIYFNGIDPLQKTNNIYDHNKTIKSANKSYCGLVNYKWLLKANPNNWKGLR